MRSEIVGATFDVDNRCHDTNRRQATEHSGLNAFPMDSSIPIHNDNVCVPALRAFAMKGH